jgi:hypothetical protein
MEEKDLENTFLSEEDKHKLIVSAMSRKLAQANVEKALAQNESADLSHKYLLLQIQLKYKISPGEDKITEDGEIIRKNKDEVE